MKSFILLSIVFLIGLGCNAQWVLQNSGTSNTLKSVFFTDEQAGFICGEQGTLLKTTDGGTNWMVQDVGTGISLNAVYFINADTGYIAGNDGVILKTTDAGDSWELLNTGTTSQLNAIRFTDASTGYVSRSDFKVGKTVDGGLSWTYATAPANGRLSIIDTNTVYLVGFDMSIFKTDDGGLNWDINVWNPFYGTLNDVCFTGQSTGIVVGGSWAQGYSYSVINYTHDSGASWHGWNQINSAWLNAACFADSTNAFAVGPDGIIFYSSNAGIQWNKQVSVSTYDLLSVHFPTSETGYAVGEAGTIMKTVNGGVGMNESLDVKNHLTVSPNPTKGDITVKLPSHISGGILSITDIQGREVMSENIHAEEQLMDLSRLKSGFYLIKAETGDRIYVAPVLKE